MFEDKLIVNALPVTDEERERFIEAAHGMEQVFVTNPEMRKKASWKLDIPPAYRERATAVIGNVNRETLAACPHIEWLQTNSAGIDSFTKPGILPEGTTIVSASGAYGPAVAEHMFALTLAIIKKLPDYRIAQFTHGWIDLGQVATLEDAQVFVIGTGDIGSRYAKMCTMMGSHVIGFNRSGHASDGFERCYTIDELSKHLPEADIVAMALPSNPETFHLMDEAKFNKMKPTAFFINVGRGDCVDTKALLWMLNNGHIAGAAIDVIEDEPLDARAFAYHAERLFLTPHVAGGNHVAKTGDRIVELAIKHLDEYVRSLMNQ